MQFLIVRARKRGTEKLVKDLSVLIDGEENGIVENLIKLDAGTVDISVNAAGADESTVDIENTTQTRPMEVIIEID